MSIIATVATAFAAYKFANAASTGIVKYNKHVYDEKISKLNNCVRSLNAKLDTLSGLRDGINEFMKGEEGDRYRKLILLKMDAIRQQIEIVEDCKARYDRISGDLEGTKVAMGAMFDTAEAALSKIGQ